MKRFLLKLIVAITFPIWVIPVSLWCLSSEAVDMYYDKKEEKCTK